MADRTASVDEPPRTRDDGAAALEFALVVPFLLILMFAMIDYGIYFSDGLATRSAVQDATRAAAVKQCDDWSCVDRLVRDRVDTVAGGAIYVKAFTEQVAPNSGAGWVQGNNLVVCAVVVVDGLTGGVEALGRVNLFPNGGSTRSRSVMRIEQDGAPHPDSSGWESTLPTDYGSWSFCA